MLRIVVMILILLIFSGCSTLFNGTTTKVAFESEPIGATVRLPNFNSCETPCTLEVENRVEKVLIEKEGYKSSLESTHRKVALGAGILGNLLIPSIGILGLLIDTNTGGLWYLDRNPMRVTLQPAEENSTRYTFVNTSGDLLPMMGLAMQMGGTSFYSQIDTSTQSNTNYAYSTLSADLPFYAVGAYFGYASEYIRLKLHTDWTLYSIRSHTLYGRTIARQDARYELESPVNFGTLSVGLWGDVSLLRIDPFDIYLGLLGGWEGFFMRDIAASLSEYAADFTPQNGLFWGVHEGIRIKLTSDTSFEIGGVMRIGGVGMPVKLDSYIRSLGYTHKDNSFSGALFLALQTRF